MALSRQRKITIVLLALYWPTLFVFAHIPIPKVVREAEVSDKGLHFLAYLILVYLLWFSVRGEEKVNWRGIGPWCILAALAVYGVLDEWSQSFVAGRSCDIRDFFADMTGTLTGLILFSIFTFWPAGLSVVAIVIFGLTNVTSANLGDLMPVTSGMFHLFAYATLTILWVQHIRHSRFGARLPKTGINRLAALSAAPMVLLLFVKLFSAIFDRAFGVRDMLISAGGIGAVIAAICLTPLLGRKGKSKWRRARKRAQLP
ncbi:MAG TPA: VanZ family protein [Sedimentisphaerales bacterium]|nr:VanZ family protein [Sedimentisphaerales bacterium]